jgi:hypothetical protein
MERVIFSSTAGSGMAERCRAVAMIVAQVLSLTRVAAGAQVRAENGRLGIPQSLARA